jgi:hypothetical protein
MSCPSLGSTVLPFWILTTLLQGSVTSGKGTTVPLRLRHTSYIGQFTGIFGPSGYKSESLNCLAEGYVGCKVSGGLQKAYDKGWSFFIGDQNAWINNYLRLQQVDKYYQEQFDRTMSEWNDMKEYIESLHGAKIVRSRVSTNCYTVRLSYSYQE